MNSHPYWKQEKKPYGILITVLREWDVEAVHRFSAFLSEDMSAPGIDNVVVDFYSIHYVDSIVLGVLVHLAKQCQARGGEVFILRPHDNLRKLFRQTGLEKQFQLFAEERDLIAYLKRTGKGKTGDPYADMGI